MGNRLRGWLAFSRRDQRKRVATTPVRLQTHTAECGAACVGSVLGYFGRWVPFHELRERCEVGRDGSSAAALLRGARHYGLQGTAWRGGADRLSKRALPAILFWEFSHFLILEGFDKDRFILNDPAVGRRTLSADEFDRGFSGVSMTFEPGPTFRRAGRPAGVLQRAKPWLAGVDGGLAWGLACGLLLAVLALVAPAMLSLFVDDVLGEAEPWGAMAAGVMAGAAVLAGALHWLKQRWTRRLAARISVIAANDCLSRLLRLPVAYFGHRMGGELVARILSIDRIATGLADQLIAARVEITQSVIFLSVIAFFEPRLALVLFGLAALNAACTRRVTLLRTEKDHALKHEQEMLLGVGMSGLYRADTRRMTATDDRFFSRWSGHQARELAARQRLAELGRVSGTLPGLLSALASAAVLALVTPRVMAGESTLGALVGLYLLATLFIASTGRLARNAEERRNLDVNLQRLEDSTEVQEEPGLRRPAAPGIVTMGERLRLAGRVELRGVTFGYDRQRPPLIDDFSLTIEPGERVALIGPSASGKSTLSHLVSGFSQPWSGEILFDGLPRHEIPREVLTRSVALVDQHIVLFSGTVRDNITFWNPAVPDQDVLAAARDAGVHDEILARPLGYREVVEENGVNFSGGERQRLQFARALVRHPSLLILDEATSALDASTEEQIDDALRRRGVSCLLIAHRLSTIRDCDQIIVLEQGKVAQRGVHNELLADQDGLYRRLVLAG